MAEKPDPGPQGWRGVLGRKISVRYRLIDDPEHEFSEALGVVQSVEESSGRGMEIRLVTRAGRTVAFEATDVTHLKVFD